MNTSNKFRQRAGAIIALGACLLAPARALTDEATGCAAFKWPVDQEQTWFAGKSVQALASGTVMPDLVAGAVTVTLDEASSVLFARPPQGKQRDGATKAARLDVVAVKAPGHYQITLSDEAWVDLIQDGHYLKTYDHSGAKGCAGVRRSLRFEVKPGRLVLQFSSAATPRLGVAIRPLD